MILYINPKQQVSFATVFLHLISLKIRLIVDRDDEERELDFEIIKRA